MTLTIDYDQWCNLRAAPDTGSPLDSARASLFGEYGSFHPELHTEHPSRVDIEDRAARAALFDLEAERRMVAAKQIWLLGEAEQTGIWRAAGHASIAGWARANLRWSDGEVSEHLCVARVSRDHPTILEAVADGRLPVRHAVVLCRAIRKHGLDQHPQFDNDLARLTRFGDLEYKRFSETVDDWVISLRPVEAAADDAQQHDQRTASVKQRDDGMFDIRLVIDPLSGELLLDAWANQVDAMFVSDWRDAEAENGNDVHPGRLARTDRQRQADAFLELIRSGAANPEASGPVDPGVLVLIDERTLNEEILRQSVAIDGDRDAVADEVADAVPAALDLLATIAQRAGESPIDPEQRTCRTPSGIAVSPATALAAALAGWVRYVLVNELGEPMAWSSKQRNFTGPIREVMLSTASTCVHPGCTRRAKGCQLDHRDEHAHGGPTCTHNCTPGPYCGRHNRFKSLTGIIPVQVRPGIWELRDRDGLLVV